MANIQNLKPFTGGDDPRRQNGRKVGSLNRATIIKEILAHQVEPQKMLSLKAKHLCEAVGSHRSYFEAIVYSLINRSLEGDSRASDALLRATERIEAEEPSDFFSTQEIQITIVNPEALPPGCDYASGANEAEII